MFDIALVAQNSKTGDLVNLVKKYRDGIARHSVVSDFETGLVIKSLTGIDITFLSSVDEGGYLQLARMVSTENLRMVIFLHDPQLSIDDPGIALLLRSCNMYNIPFANNMTTAEFILHRFLEKEMAICRRFPRAQRENDLINV